MHDVVIRGGTIVDGTGAPATTGDVAIEDGKIAALGRDVGAGCLVWGSFGGPIGAGSSGAGSIGVRPQSRSASRV